MTDFQAAKALVRAFHEDLDAARGRETEVLQRYMTPDYLWRGFHPFHELTGAEAVADRFWGPLKQALTSVQRRPDIFFAGGNSLKGGAECWVVSMGHLMGLFDAPWLGIRPTRKIAMLRYCEFLRIEGDRIAESAMFFDIPHLMAQAGQNSFGPQTGAFLVQPGPATHDGLLYDPQPEAEGVRTRAAIDFMCNDISTWTGGRAEPLEEELRRSWTEDMLWWGPHGIGATYTIPRYAVQHSGPFRQAFQERTFNGHVTRVAEGHYGGFFGWPNLTLHHKGGFMGMPATGLPGDMRVIDIYRREGDKLAENWIFIDLLHFWNMQGVDILARATGIGS
jgi:hypothetical protein